MLVYTDTSAVKFGGACCFSVVDTNFENSSTLYALTGRSLILSL